MELKKERDEQGGGKNPSFQKVCICMCVPVYIETSEQRLCAITGDYHQTLSLFTFFAFNQSHLSATQCHQEQASSICHFCKCTVSHH